MPAIDDSATEGLEGELITQEDLADAVVDDMGSDDPIVRALWDDLLRGEHAKAILAEAEMRRVIEFNQSVDHRFQEGVGQLVARIPLSVYLHWTAVHGHDFWDQPDSLDFLAKRAGGGQGNPGLLVKTQGRATIIKDAHFPPAVSAVRPPVSGVSSAAGGAPAATAHSARNNPRARRGRWAQ